LCSLQRSDTDGWVTEGHLACENPVPLIHAVCLPEQVEKDLKELADPVSLAKMAVKWK